MSSFYDNDNLKEYNMLPESEYNGRFFADDVNQRYTIKEEIDMMFKFKLIKRNRKHQLRWVKSDLNLFKYAQFIGLCDDGLLYWHDDVLWVDDPKNEFPQINWDMERF